MSVSQREVWDEIVATPRPDHVRFQGVEFDQWIKTDTIYALGDCE